MAERRLNTVYDFASLRLRPNGYRVSRSKSAHLDNYATSTVRDLNDNVFAQNALGVGALRKFRTKRVREDDDDDDEGEGEGEGDDYGYDEGGGGGGVDDICGDEDGDDLVVGGGGMQQKEGVGNPVSESPGSPPPLKRFKLLEDDAKGMITSVKTAGVFGTQDFHRSLVADDCAARNDLYPSSDLLKYIHHFASGFYHERGELPTTLPKQHPTSPAASLAPTDSTMHTPRDSSHSPSHSPSIHDTHEYGDEESAVEDEEDMSDAYSQSSNFGKNLIGMYHEDAQHHPIDMYRNLDGSALVAVGVLIEESVRRLLTSRSTRNEMRLAESPQLLSLPAGGEDIIIDSSFDMEKEESEMLNAVPLHPEKWQSGYLGRDDLDPIDSDEDPDTYLPSET